jgi:hypothetical protein
LKDRYEPPELKYPTSTEKELLAAWSRKHILRFPRFIFKVPRINERKRSGTKKVRP